MMTKSHSMDVLLMMERLATDLEDQDSISIWLQGQSIEINES